MVLTVRGRITAHGLASSHVIQFSYHEWKGLASPKMHQLSFVNILALLLETS